MNINFIPQSNLQKLPRRHAFLAVFGPPESTRVFFRLSLIYSLIWTCAVLVYAFDPALGLGLAMPGGGFLTSGTPLLLTGLSLVLFGFSLFLWFATGNVLAPIFIWLGALFLALAKAQTIYMTAYDRLIFASGPVILALIWGLKAGLWHRTRKSIQTLGRISETPSTFLSADLKEDRPVELTKNQVAKLRFLLDRALQPMEAFDGFERRDPFQTAALRYQINFLSYALSMAQHAYLPALGAYMTTAQIRLKTKQESPEIWNYWRWENIWGNLKTGRDPIAQDNIMYSGFVATQMMMALQASPDPSKDFMGELSGHKGSFYFHYSREALIKKLASQYDRTRFGLLPCEPNWIYPLCNFITASALAAHDAREGDLVWENLKSKFAAFADLEFMGVDGHFIPFRSRYCGLAAPQIGGLVMKTFPCFFLNAALPHIARRQWAHMKSQTQDKSLRASCWPIDVGNYHFSRASSYAASALAAAEMGDTAMRNELLTLMKEDCAPISKAGRYYFEKASLWANANAFMAEICPVDGFRQLMNKPKQKVGPYISKAAISDLIFTSAYVKDGVLNFAAHAENGSGYKAITVAGLTPKRAYTLAFLDQQVTLKANAFGRVQLNLPLFPENQFQIFPQ